MADKTKKEEVKETPKQEAPKPVSVHDIINAYPNDREKGRDTILLGIQDSLHRLANALEYFASQDVAEKKAKAFEKSTGPR